MINSIKIFTAPVDCITQLAGIDLVHLSDSKIEGQSYMIQTICLSILLSLGMMHPSTWYLEYCVLTPLQLKSADLYKHPDLL